MHPGERNGSERLQLIAPVNSRLDPSEAEGSEEGLDCQKCCVCIFSGGLSLSLPPLFCPLPCWPVSGLPPGTISLPRLCLSLASFFFFILHVTWGRVLGRHGSQTGLGKTTQKNSLEGVRLSALQLPLTHNFSLQLCSWQDAFGLVCHKSARRREHQLQVVSRRKRCLGSYR